jgi:hypothetical protein
LDHLEGGDAQGLEAVGVQVDADGPLWGPGEADVRHPLDQLELGLQGALGVAEDLGEVLPGGLEGDVEDGARRRVKLLHHGGGGVPGELPPGGGHLLAHLHRCPVHVHPLLELDEDQAKPFRGAGTDGVHPTQGGKGVLQGLGYLLRHLLGAGPGVAGGHRYHRHAEAGKELHPKA